MRSPEGLRKNTSKRRIKEITSRKTVNVLASTVFCLGSTGAVLGTEGCESSTSLPQVSIEALNDYPNNVPDGTIIVGPANEINFTLFSHPQTIPFKGKEYDGDEFIKTLVLIPAGQQQKVKKEIDAGISVFAKGAYQNIPAIPGYGFVVYSIQFSS